MWSRGLRRWYVRHGRHELPWRATRDPWAVLVSEVMLQQTQVARVIPKWQEFMQRWPTPAAFATAGLDDVLRCWKGLGYPRRALALHRCAHIVQRDGWPGGEAGMRAMPGIGAYTARALLTLAMEQPAALPRDVNITRVVARAALGAEPGEVTAAALDVEAARGRPHGMSRRDYTLALFDAGALHCRSVPRCTACPLERACARRLGPPRPAAAARRRQPPYAGSFRALRGAVLAAALEDPAAAGGDVVARLAPADAGEVQRALASLVSDGLLGSRYGSQPHPQHHG